MRQRIITSSALALVVASLSVAGAALAATGETDTDWTQPVVVFLVAWIALAVGIHLLTRRRRRARSGFLSWEVQLGRKRSGRPWRDQRAV